MTRWEILDKAKEVLEGKHGNASIRKLSLGAEYKAVQRVVDAIIEGEDYISKEIEKHKEEIRKLEKEKAREKAKERAVKQ